MRTPFPTDAARFLSDIDSALCKILHTSSIGQLRHVLCRCEADLTAGGSVTKAMLLLHTNTQSCRRNAGAHKVCALQVRPPTCARLPEDMRGICRVSIADAVSSLPGRPATFYSLVFAILKGPQRWQYAPDSGCRVPAFGEDAQCITLGSLGETAGFTIRAAV